ncbi:MAG: GNAT family N-acetyltransferase [Clostridia bacterium]|nr:GNAT family N-acetyltransferase [Clostridia bacterium]
MINTKRLTIVPAEIADIDRIMAIENHVDNRKFVWQGSYEQHKAEIADPAYLLLKFILKDTADFIGIALIHLDFKSHVLELRRLAVTEKGQGYGREVLTALIDHAFKEMDINRFWLDVYTDNTIGIHLYESLGFVKEGILRQNYKAERGYLDQIVYSILRTEYIQKSYGM